MACEHVRLCLYKVHIMLQGPPCSLQVSQLLRLSLFWSSTSPFVPQKVQRWNSDGKLCRIYLSVSLGLLEPFFLITALLLCGSTLRWLYTSNSKSSSAVDCNRVYCVS